jgi:holo-[acyl-carrier protein] synthase
LLEFAKCCYERRDLLSVCTLLLSAVIVIVAGAVAAQHYAARFAAKEAALKALQTGWRGGISWQDVEISSRESGAPFLIFSGEVLKIFEKFGATSTHLSISHTSEHAIAQVVLER